MIWKPAPLQGRNAIQNVTYRFTWGSDARDGYSQANSHTRVIEAFRCPISLGLCMCWLQPCGDVIHRLIKVHHWCIHWALRTILGNGAVNIISTCASTYPPTRKTTNRHATWAVTHPIIPVHMGYETSPVPHMHGSVYDGNTSCHRRKTNTVTCTSYTCTWLMECMYINTHTHAWECTNMHTHVQHTVMWNMATCMMQTHQVIPC